MNGFRIVSIKMSDRCLSINLFQQFKKEKSKMVSLNHERAFNVARRLSKRAENDLLRKYFNCYFVSSIDDTHCVLADWGSCST